MGNASYQMPTTDLLDKVGSSSISKEEMRSTGMKIVDVLAKHHVDVLSMRVSSGPTVSLYTFELMDENSVKRVMEIQKDEISDEIALKGVRITRHLPSMRSIDVEVPNITRSLVSIREIFESDEFQNNDFELPIVIGKTFNDKNVIADLTKMPHLLVGGAPGGGRQVLTNAIMTSLLLKKRPSELKFVLIDPKMVELCDYEPIEKHYLAKVSDQQEAIITDSYEAVRALNSLIEEMNKRYDLLREAKARNVKEYNSMYDEGKLDKSKFSRLPYIVTIIQEYGDFMLQFGGKIESPIAMLAQKSHAVGIHMILSTRRTSYTVITGLIRANFPASFAFMTYSPLESKLVLGNGDESACHLMGKGDMVFNLGTGSRRAQCAWVSDEEVRRISDYISGQETDSDAYLLPEVEQVRIQRDVIHSDFKDPLLPAVAEHIVTSQDASTSLVQRKFCLGYNRACSILEALEEAKVIGPFKGSTPRKIFVKELVELHDILDEIIPSRASEKNTGEENVPRSPQTVFELIGISCDDVIIAERKCSSTSLGLYSTLSLAEKRMREETQTQWGGYWAYVIEELPFDRGRRIFQSYRSYNRKGEPNDECLLDDSLYFHGRTPEQIRFQKGDIVWALGGGYLTLGIITQLPPSTEWVKEREELSMYNYRPFIMDDTDDVYTVYSIGEGDTQRHIFSPKVFPVTEEVPEGLVQQLRDKHKEMEELYGTK